MKEFELARAEALESDKLGFKVEWLSNTYDPSRHDARLMIHTRFDQSPEDAWHDYQEWLKDKIIGEPKGMENYTPEQLIEMHMVGVYRKCLPEEQGVPPSVVTRSAPPGRTLVSTIPPPLRVSLKRAGGERRIYGNSF